MKKLTINFRKSLWLALSLLPSLAWAQEAGGGGALFPGINNSALLMGVLLTTLVLLLCIFAVLAYVTYSLIAPLSAQPVAQAEESSPFWAWFWNKFNAAKPISKEQDILMGHSYDGIQELDNDLPPWWKYGFYLTIVFAVIYMYIYHGESGKPEISLQEFTQESAELETRRNAYLAKAESMIDESSVVPLDGKADLLVGQDIYVQNCKACHGGAGEGGVGPNMTDVYWLHGGGIKNIFKTIKHGVPEKGMISWKEKLTPKQMQQVGSYILQMQGTTPPNAKEPQGQKYEEKAL